MKFEEVYAINVNDKTEKKQNLTYLSWAWAWAEFMKAYPEATYKIERTADGLSYFGNDKHGYMCHTSVTANGITHEMWLPVMDMRNKSLLVPTSFDINKTLMRCLTKNLAMFGLGLYIYAGEDLPEDETPQKAPPKTPYKAPPQQATPPPVQSTTAPKYITLDQQTEVKDIFKEKRWDLNKAMSDQWHITKLEKMTVEMYQGVLKAIAK